MRRRRFFMCGLAAACVTAALRVPLGGSGVYAQVPPPCDPSLPCRLSVNLPETQGFTFFQLAPNGERVIFIHVSDGQIQDLYSAPVAGGESPTQLDSPAFDQIRDVMISPDSTRVVYRASRPGSTESRLLSVPITGPASANVRLASNVPIGRTQISPDSRKVVFQPAMGDRLRAVPIAGPASAGVRLTAPVVAGGSIGNFAISADSHSVVYMAEQDTVGVRELYRVPLTLSPQPDPPTVKLSAPDDGPVLRFKLAPNNRRVVYQASQDDVIELHSVRLGGSGRSKLTPPLPTGWDVLPSDAGYTIVPDGSQVVYKIVENPIVGEPDSELYSVPITGPASASVQLDDPPSATTDVGLHQVSADSAWVVYTVADDVNTWAYSVPVAGPANASVLLTWPSPAGELFTLSPDSAHVVWQLDLAEVPEQLFSTPIAGTLGDSVRINGDEQPAGLALVNASSTRAVYIAQAPGSTERDVFSVPLSGSGPRYNLTASLDAPFIQGPVALTSDGERVVYAAQEPDGGFHLYSSRLVPSL